MSPCMPRGRYATNCLVHKFKEAGGCEAEMMFVRPGFDVRLVRSFCQSQRPHSCGPGAWSLPEHRGAWDAQTKVWARETAKEWPALPLTPAAQGGRGARARRSRRLDKRR